MTFPRFRALASSRLSVERDAQGRVWTQLFPLGTWHRSDFPGGKVELTAAFLASFITSWKAGGSPPLPLDYDHNEEGPASGWIEDLRQSASGELEGAVKWTEDAAADIKADKRRYLSPTWSMRHVNRRTGEKGGPWLYGAALLNDPFYDSMPRVAAAAPTPPDRSNTMTEEQLNELRANLGLSSTATAEEILSASKPLVASASETVEKLTAAVKSKGDLEAKLKASQEECVTLKATAEAAQAERFAEQVTVLVADGKREGRPLDALAATSLFKAAKSLADVKALIASVPVSVPLKTTGTPGANEAPTAENARQTYDAAVQAKVAAGAKYTEAARLTAREMPEISKLVFTTTSST